jgi:hypothetical protein
MDKMIREILPVHFGIFRYNGFLRRMNSVGFTLKREKGNHQGPLLFVNEKTQVRSNSL